MTDDPKLLQGKKILLTRPAEQVAELAGPIQELGGQAIIMPMICIVEPESWQEFDLAFKRLADFAWIIFASTNAVKMTISRAETLGKLEALQSCRIACIGAGQAKQLESKSLKASFVPSKALAEAFVAEFPAFESQRKKDGTAGNLILWPRTNIGRTLIKDELERSGWQVEIVSSYRSMPPEPEIKKAYSMRLLSLLRANELDVITLTSSETVRILAEIIDLSAKTGAQSKESLLKQTKLAVIGPQTAGTCLDLLGRVDIEAEDHSIEGMLAELKKAFS